MSSDWEYDELDEDWTDDDSEEEIPSEQCPECGAEIYFDADVCPQCGHYIVHSNSPWEGKSPLWILLGVLGIFAVIIAMLGISFF